MVLTKNKKHQISRDEVTASPESFRDPRARVFTSANHKIYRFLSLSALNLFRKLEAEPFYASMKSDLAIVETNIMRQDDPISKLAVEHGFAGALNHKKIDVISYPYEWPVSALKDAALLTLELLKTSMSHSWTLRDASSFNVQFVGVKPIFIDLTSFTEWKDGDLWSGYSQFARHFLLPLMLRHAKGINYHFLLKSNLDGISIELARSFLGPGQLLSKGCFFHIFLPFFVEKRLKPKSSNAHKRPAGRKFNGQMTIALLDSLLRLVSSLSFNTKSTQWYGYENNLPYQKIEIEEKEAFVRICCESAVFSQVLDLGCNTGRYSILAAQFCENVVAIDKDPDCIDALYKKLKCDLIGNVLPLIIDLANPSPAHGWREVERAPFFERVKPDLIMCLALIHHMVLTNNIPVREIVSWLHGFFCKVIIEVPHENDEMVRIITGRKQENEIEYSLEFIKAEIQVFFDVLGIQTLSGGTRTLMFLEPKAINP